MSKQCDSKEPDAAPAPLPQFSSIIAEGNREIGARARAAVETILTKGDFASPAELSKWGPSGAKYFFKVLQQRIAGESKPPAAASPAQTAVDPQLRAEHDAKRSKGMTPNRKGSPVATDRDWTAHQHNRWPTRTRAIVHGMLVAAAIFAGAAVFIRLWPSLVATVQQQIQNRS